MKRKCLAFVIILLFIGTGIIPSTAQDIEKPSLPISRGDWLYVGGNGPGNYTKIQDAINASYDENTIFVFNGTYYEHLNVNKSLRILGQEVDTTIIDGQGTSNVVTISASVTISGFTIQHSGRLYGSDAGISTHSQPDMSYVLNISGNCIKNNKNGVFIGNSHNDIITNNMLMDNEQGIFLFLTSDCKINNNNFINNTNHTFFTYIFLLQRFPRNNWNGNYWDDWHSVLPKPIQDVKELIYLVLRPGMIISVPIPWINFDWHLAQEPYDIPQKNDLRKTLTQNTI